MSEEDGGNNIQGITRRRFLGSLAAVPLVRPLKALERIAAFLSPRQDENLEEIQKKKEVEEKFGVKLVTLKEFYAQNPHKIPKQRAGFGPKESWDLSYLKLAEEVLNILPSHFYQPDETGKRLTIILSNRSHLGDKEDNSLFLDGKFFRPDDRHRALQALAHELIHSITPVEISFDPTINKQSAWFDKIYQILGGAYSQPPEALSAQLLEQAGQSNVKLANPDTLLGRMNYAINWDYPNELVAILGEFYLLGKDYFVESLDPYIGQEQREELYRFIKEEVFRGREYAWQSPPAQELPVD